MRLIGKIILAFISNAVALATAAYFISGFTISYDPPTFLWITALFTAINIVIKPVVKLLLTPFIVVTLGALTLVINAGMLWLLDFLSADIIIMGLAPLIYSTLIISFINIFINSTLKSAYKKAL